MDFSKFAAGTKIQMNNLYVGSGSSPTLGQVMQFTVQSGTPCDAPFARLCYPCFREAGSPEAGRSNAVQSSQGLRRPERPDGDSCPDPALPSCNQRTLDGLEFSAPATELPLVGLTEEWDLIHMMDPRQDDQDKNFHQIHIHPIEFQVLNRQPIDAARYREQWHSSTATCR